MVGKQLNLLSLDGGGIRGLLIIRFLKEIGLTTKYINENFDYIIGTSTGGIIGTCIRLGFELCDIEKLFCDYNIFSELFSKNWSFFGYFATKYNGDKMLNYLKEYKINDVKIFDKNYNETLFDNKYLMITSYDVTRNYPVVFKNFRETHKNIKLYEILRATSAAPSYFEPQSIIRKDGIRKYVDGGIWSNDPSLIGYNEVLKHINQNFTHNQLNDNPIEIKHNDFKISVLSIGTGIYNGKLDMSYGKLKWAPHISNLFMTAICNSNDLIMNTIKNHLSIGYERYQFKLNNEIELDNYNEIENLKQLNINDNITKYKNNRGQT